MGRTALVPRRFGYGHCMTIPPSLLTVKDLARVFQISARTIRRWQRAGHLPPPLRIGGSLRWPAADLHAWLARQRSGDPPISDTPLLG